MNKSYFIILNFIALITFTFAYAQDSASIGYKKYIDNNKHYEISYPENWFAKNGALYFGKYKGTVHTFFDNINNNSNWPNYNNPKETSLLIITKVDSTAKDIEDKIKRYKIRDDLKSDQLKNVKELVIDNHKLKVWYPKYSNSCHLDFIFNRMFYSLVFRSGSANQFLIDYPVFENMLKSFRFIE